MNVIFNAFNVIFLLAFSFSNYIWL